MMKLQVFGACKNEFKKNVKAVLQQNNLYYNNTMYDKIL